MAANLIIQGGIVSANHMQTGGGGGQKSGKFANVIYERPLYTYAIWRNTGLKRGKV